MALGAMNKYVQNIDAECIYIVFTWFKMLYSHVVVLMFIMKA